eukprot:CAMPEP_0198112762 /NCGR_PEP_ID=MMETSP1442-20131203/4555_1 /TAXON_ID= /ORGANISM="Craspedostauros australis, Strain CCMP3328" /LENGTH=292 /DNA_ID=CAMNT_0043769659 /DNA_START=143 /DNA_END=1021 /DNA_ORIENTATION=-
MYKGKLPSSGNNGKHGGEGVEAESHLITDLPTLIRNQKWEAVIRRLEFNPDEAEEQLRTTTRGGFVAGTGFLPLHYACERRPPVEVVDSLIQACPGAVTTRCMPGGCLPLHVACTWYAPLEAVKALLLTDRASCKIQDELGNTPLHSACFSGTSAQVLEMVIRAYPKALQARNHQGSLPEDVATRLRHDNRGHVLYLLAKYKDELVAKQRNKRESSADLANVTNRALNLNERGYGHSQRREGHDLAQKNGKKHGPSHANPPPQTGENESTATPKEEFEVAYERNNGDDLVWV